MDSCSMDVDSVTNASERRSCRFKIRKKFDDELVESCLPRSSGSSVSKTRPANATITSSEIDDFQPVQTIPETVVSNTTPSIQPINPFKVPTNAITINPVTPEQSNLRNRPSSSKSKRKCPHKNLGRTSSSKNKKKSSNKNLGSWKPTDDFMLIQSVMQTNNLPMVHKGVKFSCKFTLKEVSDRWSALLYDRIISNVALSAIQKIHPVTRANMESKILFSIAEEELLMAIQSNSQPSIETFQELFDQNLHIFHHKRTPQILMNHWNLLKQYCLLSDQASALNNPITPFLSNIDERNMHILNNEQEVATLSIEHIPTFAECEALIDDQQLLNEKPKPNVEVFKKHLKLTEQKVKQQIKILEDELPRAEALVYPITGMDANEFDSETFAVLRGRTVKYLMRSREITIGRSSKFVQVDVDLKLEGLAFKISRRQATIYLRTTGDFFIVCEGQRTLYISGKPLKTGDCGRLYHNSVLEIAGLRFIFIVNHQLIRRMKKYGFEEDQMSQHANPKSPNKTVINTEKPANSRNPNQNMQQQKLFEKIETIGEQNQQQPQQQQLFQLQQLQENMLEDQEKVVLQQQQKELDQQLQLLVAELSASF